MEWLLIGILVMTLLLLAVTEVYAAIRIVAFQGAMLSVLPLVENNAHATGHLVFMSVGIFIIKVIVIPLLLFRSVREVQNEVEPEQSKGINFSSLVGGAMILFAFVVPTFPGFSPLTIHVALSTVLIGFLLLILRRRAVLQVVGFLVLENGIFLFGLTLVSEFPFTVEMGVLLDLLVGVFVMGIMIYHINRTFDHIDISEMDRLTDSD